MIELVDVTDSRALRNKDNVLRWYDLMINKKQAEAASAKYVSPDYIQHNPLIPDGADGLGRFFGQVTKERTRPRVVVHRIIAVGDYVCAHVNFLNVARIPRRGSRQMSRARIRTACSEGDRR